MCIERERVPFGCKFFFVMDWTPVNNVDGNSIYSMELGGARRWFFDLETYGNGIRGFSDILQFIGILELDYVADKYVGFIQWPQTGHSTCD